MSNNMNSWSDTICIIIGTATSISVGALFLQALTALAVGALGACGSWLFVRFGKPILEKIIDKFKAG